MATLYALAAVTQTILGILADARPKPEFDDAKFEAFQFKDFQREPPISLGMSLYLYRVSVNASQRNMPPSVDIDGRMRHRLPLDLHYMITAWAMTAINQQRLLGWCMRTLEDTSCLSATLLNNYGRPERSFHPAESVQLLYDPMSLQDTIQLWDVLKPNIQLSVTYTARVVYLESPLEMGGEEPVQSRELRMVKWPPA